MRQLNAKPKSLQNTLVNPDVVIQSTVQPLDIETALVQRVTKKYQRLMQSEIEQFQHKIRSFTEIGGLDHYLTAEQLQNIHNLPDLFSHLHRNCLAQAEEDVSLVAKLTHHAFDLQHWKGYYNDQGNTKARNYETGFRLLYNKTHPSTVLAKAELLLAQSDTRNACCFLLSPDRTRMVLLNQPSNDLNEHPRSYNIVLIECAKLSFKVFDKVLRFLVGFAKDGSQRFAYFSGAGLELL